MCQYTHPGFILYGHTKTHRELIKCNNRVTVSRVIHLSLRKETDVQYLEAPNSMHAAGSYRLMFKANTPLTAHFNNWHVFPMAYYSSINSYNMSSCLPNPFSDLSCYPDCTSKQVVLPQ